MKNKGSEPNTNHQKKERTEVLNKINPPTQGYWYLLSERYQRQKVSSFLLVYQSDMHLLPHTHTHPYV